MYFSCDVGKFYSRSKGTLDLANFDYDSLMSVEFGMNKQERVMTHASGSSHAMTLIAVDIVDGKTEGLLGLLGAMDDENDEISVIDIGGASVELIRGNHSRITYAHSAPLGNLRLLDGAGEREEDIEKFIDERISQFGIVTATQAVAIGGTATSLASMALGQTTYDQNQTHGCVISLDELCDLKRRIFASKNRQADFPTLSAKRARIIGHGIIMLIKMLQFLDLCEVRVSELDNMEGYLKYKLNN
jgi:exopolyphosphatase/pppGpp-phosphohydrolase